MNHLFHQLYNMQFMFKLTLNLLLRIFYVTILLSSLFILLTLYTPKCSLFYSIIRDLLLLLSASPYSGSPQRDSNLHFTRSTSSPSLAPTLTMSSLTKSIHLLLGLPLFLLPGTAISIILFPT